MLFILPNTLSSLIGSRFAFHDTQILKTMMDPGEIDAQYQHPQQHSQNPVQYHQHPQHQPQQMQHNTAPPQLGVTMGDAGGMNGVSGISENGFGAAMSHLAGGGGPGGGDFMQSAAAG
eukprot:UC4_evm1s158